MATQRWPTRWLLTDERMGEALGPAMERAAAAGAGIMVRHLCSSVAVRRDLARQVVRSGAMLAIARDVDLALSEGARLVHDPVRISSDLSFSLPVHDEAEAVRAAGLKPALVFVSPVYPTRSHPGAPALGPEKAKSLAALAGWPAVALGGMDEERGAAMVEQGFAGWAGIDCWLRT